MHEKIIILDFGGQYAHLIASRVRRENVLAEIFNPDEVSTNFLKDEKIKGIILSGGPQSVFDADSPKCEKAIFELGKPVLGICYGHQFLNHELGGEVVSGEIKEYGPAELEFDGECPLFSKIPNPSETDKSNVSPKTPLFPSSDKYLPLSGETRGEGKTVVWMSHGDEVVKLAPGFQVCGHTDNCENAAVWNAEKKLFGIQFHPEVTHSEHGNQILKNFLEICEVNYDWSIEKFLKEEKEKIRQKVGDKNVILFVSGGVDSTVAFALLSKVLGPERVKGLFVNTGLLREGEVEFVKESLENIGTQLTILDAEKTFLKNLEGVYEPEKKREIIGNTFLEVQHQFFSENDLHDDWILAQGTIYPDTIETGGTKNAAKIKTHHNRVPEIQKLIDEGKVIEPIAELYKDEVRNLGELLGLPHHLVWRHPFPGPGLGVRILCSSEQLQMTNDELQMSDDTIRLPIKSVGVQGDSRTYRHPEILKRNNITDIPALETRATMDININPEVNRTLVQIEEPTYAKASAGRKEFATVKVEKSHITPERVKRLQRADHIVTQTLEEMDLYQKVWQFPTVLVPISFDDKGKESIILRPIDSIDAMSASVGKLPWDFFEKVSAEILKDPNISAVFLDVTSKPPGTIEWE